MENPEKIFSRVAKDLKSQAWFKKEKWLLSTHFFPEKSPEALTLHVFKPHWFNADRQGIHVESFLALDEKKRAKSFLTVHLLHHDFIPGTKVNRRDLSIPVVDQVFAEVSSWKGYKFRTGKYGVQPFTFAINGTGLEFERVLVGEIARVCRKFGPAIDQALKDLV